MPDVILRPSARILLVDHQERILLFRGLGPTKNPDYAWFTPGGGVRPGEALTEAVARELEEETGHAVSPGAFGPIVATSSGHWIRADGQLFRADDSFFFLRVREVEVDISHMEDLERSLIDRYHWWTLPELKTTDERVIPLGLAELLERLLTGDLPREPVILPWHHPEPTDFL
ncbi:NUDIX domain-containing protein [Planotetraspora sp. A-T 1434]|uniref:NUDIX hydrolase n=1 Tax=Planotetraspora sp. A-T 1434 TaxID=2979219 RepID=UPI0021C1C2D7|nr:NUDIX domain-containing protein [Planotetraspora sp. A-T 1434]MCT9931470.1 NUDIX domain-containing protein [Planotetraspora sp. A-T 1434]